MKTTLQPESNISQTLPNGLFVLQAWDVEVMRGPLSVLKETVIWPRLGMRAPLAAMKADPALLPALGTTSWPGASMLSATWSAAPEPNVT